MIGVFVCVLGVLVLVGSFWFMKKKNEHWNRYRAINQSDAFKVDETSDDELFNLDADHLEFEDEPAYDDNYSFYSSTITEQPQDANESKDLHDEARMLTAGLDDSLGGDPNFDADAWDEELKKELGNIQTELAQ